MLDICRAGPRQQAVIGGVGIAKALSGGQPWDRSTRPIKRVQLSAQALLVCEVHLGDAVHDPSSQMMDMLVAALRDGKLCVIDVSQMRGTPALVLSGLILRRIFDTNQQEFTKAQPQTIPVIAVVEEAQSVLGSEGSSGEGAIHLMGKGGPQNMISAPSLLPSNQARSRARS